MVKDARAQAEAEDINYLKNKIKEFFNKTVIPLIIDDLGNNYASELSFSIYKWGIIQINYLLHVERIEKSVLLSKIDFDLSFKETQEGMQVVVSISFPKPMRKYFKIKGLSYNSKYLSSFFINQGLYSSFISQISRPSKDVIKVKNECVGFIMKNLSKIEYRFVE